MQKTPITWAAVLAVSLGTPAFAQAQVKGDAPEVQGTGLKKATEEEKLQARAKRRAEGTATAREGIVSDRPESAGVRKVRDASETRDAKIKRRAATVDAVRKGEIPSGDK